MKKLLLAILLLCSVGKCYAFSPEKSVQDTAKAGINNLPVQTIWLNGGQLLRNEIQIGYELQVTHWLSMEFTGGYKYPVNGKQTYEITLPSIINFTVYDYAERMPFSEGILASLGFKIYPDTEKSKKARTYISPQFFYRSRSFRNKTINVTTEKYDDSRNADAGLQSLDLHIFGGKFLLGKTINLTHAARKKRVVLDLYGGFGYRFKKAKINFHDYDRNLPPPSPYIRPQTKNAENTIASLQLGFKLGYQF